MILPILLDLLLLLESSQSLRRATMRLLRCSNQEQKISAIEVNSLLGTSLAVNILLNLRGFQISSQFKITPMPFTVLRLKNI